MQRSDLALAALATAAVPGLRAVEVRAIASDGDDDVALVVDDERRRWIVRSPRSTVAGASLEAEMTLLRSFGAYVDSARLPFAVPAPAGFAQLDEGGRAVTYPEIPGTPLPLEHLRPGPGLARALGQAVAALHELPASLVEDAGLPSYTADDYRRRRLAELDEAASTGRVPVRLLRRWEGRLEDVAVWRFRPVVTHGDLDPDHVLVAQQTVNGIVDWASCQVADPADDLARLVVGAPEDAVESVLEAYRQTRTELADTHLVDRAHLVSELALVRWLLHGVHLGDESIQADAVEMMLDLDDALHPAGESPATGSVRVSAAVASGAALEGAVPVEATEVADGTAIVSGTSARSGASALSGASAVTGTSAVSGLSAASAATGAIESVDEVTGADTEASADAAVHVPTAATEAIDIADARAAWAAYDDVPAADLDEDDVSRAPGSESSDWVVSPAETPSSAETPSADDADEDRAGSTAGDEPRG